MKRAKKKDQYGKVVPNDLVLLPWDVGSLSGSLREIKIITRARWYEPGVPSFRPILASAKELGRLSVLCDDPLDAGLDVNDPQIEIWRVDDALKRWSEEDGFYHA